MTPEQIYIPIPVEQELPKKVNENYLTISERGVKTSRFFNDHERFETAHYEGKITHWLKPVTRYIFTKDELEKVVGDAFEAARGATYTTEQATIGIKWDFSKQSYLKTIIP